MGDRDLRDCDSLVLAGKHGRWREGGRVGLRSLARKDPRLLRFVRRTKVALSKEGSLWRERELALLPFLVPRNCTAVDVGANLGIYTEALVRLGVQVVAIEPNPPWAADLSAMFKDVRVIRGAASNAPGRTALRVPTSVSYAGMATIETNNLLQGQKVGEVMVDVFTIDSLDLPDVGFIKIDVEGHEDAVLEGATETIRTHRPNLLVESEERHRPGSISSLVRRMCGLGYAGYMLWNGAIRPISQLSLKTSQTEFGSTEKVPKTSTERYVNNFVFLPG
jgi:FkbM family methyltransferase